MAIKARIEQFAPRIELLFPDTFSPQARSRAIAKMAKEELAKAQAKNWNVLGRVPPHETFVDGKQHAPEISVKPDGQIVYEFELLEDVFIFVREQLEKHSPVGHAGDGRPGHPGMYRRSHILTADYDLVMEGQPFPAADEYAFVSTVPYARKIEGAGSRPPLSLQAPHGVYQVVADLAKKRFGNIAQIRFSYRSIAQGDIDAWAAGTNLATPYRRGAERAEWLRRQPAVVISVR
jgi:hypothetical protein